MHFLTELPNELWLTVFSYLNTVDIFRAFHEFDQRFDELVYEYARQVTLPIDITSDWLEEYMSDLENLIKIMCLDVKSLQDVFGNRWSFPNLRLINLQGNGWSMSLRIEEEPVSIILMSSLNFLQDAGIAFNTLYYHVRSNILDNEDNYNQTLSCPYVERLSVEVHFMRSLPVIRARAPNLTHLKINYMIPDRYAISFIESTNRIEQTTRLVTLEITAKNLMSFDIVEQLIGSYKSSLKKLVLDVRCRQSINGYHLESIFRSCQQLKKLQFFFRHHIVNIEDCFNSFQSEWWLDMHRPAVYIQPNYNDDAIIASMPSCHPFTFQNGLYNWLINKGDQNSSFVRFNTNQIHFTNKIHQSINLEFLYFIKRIFTSSNQSLYFHFCNLDTIDLLFYLLMDDPSLIPLLTNVKYFIVSSHNKLDELTLCVWILLMPNLQDLDISKLTIFNKTELAKGLKDMINKHQRLQTSFDRLNRLILFSQDDNVDTERSKKLTMTFQNLFVKATI